MASMKIELNFDEKKALQAIEKLREEVGDIFKDLKKSIPDFQKTFSVMEKEVDKFLQGMTQNFLSAFKKMAQNIGKVLHSEIKKRMKDLMSEAFAQADPSKMATGFDKIRKSVDKVEKSINKTVEAVNKLNSVLNATSNRLDDIKKIQSIGTVTAGAASRASSSVRSSSSKSRREFSTRGQKLSTASPYRGAGGYDLASNKSSNLTDVVDFSRLLPVFDAIGDFLTLAGRNEPQLEQLANHMVKLGTGSSKLLTGDLAKADNATFKSIEVLTSETSQFAGRIRGATRNIADQFQQTTKIATGMATGYTKMIRSAQEAYNVVNKFDESKVKKPGGEETSLRGELNNLLSDVSGQGELRSILQGKVENLVTRMLDSVGVGDVSDTIESRLKKLSQRATQLGDQDNVRQYFGNIDQETQELVNTLRVMYQATEDYGSDLYTVAKLVQKNRESAKKSLQNFARANASAQANEGQAQLTSPKDQEAAARQSAAVLGQVFTSIESVFRKEMDPKSIVGSTGQELTRIVKQRLTEAVSEVHPNVPVNQIDNDIREMLDFSDLDRIQAVDLLDGTLERVVQDLIGQVNKVGKKLKVPDAALNSSREALRAFDDRISQRVNRIIDQSDIQSKVSPKQLSNLGGYEKIQKQFENQLFEQMRKGLGGGDSLAGGIKKVLQVSLESLENQLKGAADTPGADTGAIQDTQSTVKQIIQRIEQEEKAIQRAIENQTLAPSDREAEVKKRIQSLMQYIMSEGKEAAQVIRSITEVSGRFADLTKGMQQVAEATNRAKTKSDSYLDNITTVVNKLSGGKGKFDNLGQIGDENLVKTLSLANVEKEELVRTGRTLKRVQSEGNAALKERVNLLGLASDIQRRYKAGEISASERNFLSSKGFDEKSVDKFVNDNEKAIGDLEDRMKQVDQAVQFTGLVEKGEKLRSELERVESQYREIQNLTQRGLIDERVSQEALSRLSNQASKLKGEWISLATSGALAGEEFSKGFTQVFGTTDKFLGDINGLQSEIDEFAVKGAKAMNRFEVEAREALETVDMLQKSSTLRGAQTYLQMGGTGRSAASDGMAQGLKEAQKEAKELNARLVQVRNIIDNPNVSKKLKGNIINSDIIKSIGGFKNINKEIEKSARNAYELEQAVKGVGKSQSLDESISALSIMESRFQKVAEANRRIDPDNMAQMGTAINQSNIALKTLDSTTANARQKLEELRYAGQIDIEEYNRLNKTLNQLETNLGDTRDQISSQVREMSSVKTAVDDYEKFNKEVAQLEVRMESLKAAFNAENITPQAYNDAIKTIQNRIKSMRQDLEGARTTLEGAVGGAQKGKRPLKARVSLEGYESASNRLKEFEKETFEAASEVAGRTKFMQQEVNKNLEKLGAAFQTEAVQGGLDEFVNKFKGQALQGNFGGASVLKNGIKQSREFLEALVRIRSLFNAGLVNAQTLERNPFIQYIGGVKNLEKEIGKAEGRVKKFERAAESIDLQKNFSQGIKELEKQGKVIRETAGLMNRQSTSSPVLAESKIKQGTTVLGQYDQQAKELVQTLFKLRASNQITEEAFQKNYAQVGKNIDQNQRYINSLQKNVQIAKDVRERSNQMSKSVDGFSSSLARSVVQNSLFATSFGIIFGVTTALRETIRTYVDLEKQAARVVNVTLSVRQSNEELAETIQGELVRAAEKFGITLEEGSAILREYGSAGVDAETAMLAFNSTLETVIATEGDAEEVTRTISAIYSVMGDTIETTGGKLQKIERINDVIVRAFKDSQLELTEAVQGYRFAGAAAQNVGVSFEELTALLGVLNNNFIKSGQAGRSLQSNFSQLAKKAPQVAEAFDIEIDTSKPIEYVEILEKISEKLSTGALSGERVKQVFEIFDLRGARSFLVLAQNFDQYEKMFESIENNAQGAAEASSGIIVDTVERQFKRLKEVGKETVRSIMFAIVGDDFNFVKEVFGFLASSLKAVTRIFEGEGVIGVITRFVAKVYALQLALKVLAITGKTLGFFTQIKSRFLSFIGVIDGFPGKAKKFNSAAKGVAASNTAMASSATKAGGALSKMGAFLGSTLGAATLIAAVYAVVKAIDVLKNKSENIDLSEIAANQQEIKENIQAYDRVIDKLDQLSIAQRAGGINARETGRAVRGLAEEYRNSVEELNQFTNLTNESLGNSIDRIVELTKRTRELQKLQLEDTERKRLQGVANNVNQDLNTTAIEEIAIYGQTIGQPDSAISEEASAIREAALQRIINLENAAAGNAERLQRALVEAYGVSEDFAFRYANDIQQETDELDEAVEQFINSNDELIEQVQRLEGLQDYSTGQGFLDKTSNTFREIRSWVTEGFGDTSNLMEANKVISELFAGVIDMENYGVALSSGGFPEVFRQLEQNQEDYNRVVQKYLDLGMRGELTDTQLVMLQLIQTSKQTGKALSQAFIERDIQDVLNAATELDSSIENLNISLLSVSDTLREIRNLRDGRNGLITDILFANSDRLLSSTNTQVTGLIEPLLEDIEPLLTTGENISESVQDSISDVVMGGVERSKARLKNELPREVSRINQLIEESNEKLKTLGEGTYVRRAVDRQAEDAFGRNSRQRRDERTYEVDNSAISDEEREELKIPKINEQEIASLIDSIGSYEELVSVYGEISAKFENIEEDLVGSGAEERAQKLFEFGSVNFQNPFFGPDAFSGALARQQFTEIRSNLANQMVDIFQDVGKTVSGAINIDLSAITSAQIRNPQEVAARVEERIKGLNAFAPIQVTPDIVGGSIEDFLDSVIEGTATVEEINEGFEYLSENAEELGLEDFESDLSSAADTATALSEATAQIGSDTIEAAVQMRAAVVNYTDVISALDNYVKSSGQAEFLPDIESATIDSITTSLQSTLGGRNDKIFRVVRELARNTADTFNETVEDGVDKVTYSVGGEQFEFTSNDATFADLENALQLYDLQNARDVDSVFQSISESLLEQNATAQKIAETKQNLLDTSREYVASLYAELAVQFEIIDSATRRLNSSANSLSQLGTTGAELETRRTRLNQVLGFRAEQTTQSVLDSVNILQKGLTRSLTTMAQITNGWAQVAAEGIKSAYENSDARKKIFETTEDLAETQKGIEENARKIRQAVQDSLNSYYGALESLRASATEAISEDLGTVQQLYDNINNLSREVAEMSLEDANTLDIQTKVVELLEEQYSVVQDIIESRREVRDLREEEIASLGKIIAEDDQAIDNASQLRVGMIEINRLLSERSMIATELDHLSKEQLQNVQRVQEVDTELAKQMLDIVKLLEEQDDLEKDLKEAAEARFSVYEDIYGLIQRTAEEAESALSEFLEGRFEIDFSGTLNQLSSVMDVDTFLPTDLADAFVEKIKQVPEIGSEIDGIFGRLVNRVQETNERLEEARDTRIRIAEAQAALAEQQFDTAFASGDIQEARAALKELQSAIGRTAEYAPEYGIERLREVEERLRRLGVLEARQSLSDRNERESQVQTIAVNLLGEDFTFESFEQLREKLREYAERRLADYEAIGELDLNSVTQKVNEVENSSNRLTTALTSVFDTIEEQGFRSVDVIEELNEALGVTREIAGDAIFDADAFESESGSGGGIQRYVREGDIGASPESNEPDNIMDRLGTKFDSLSEAIEDLTDKLGGGQSLSIGGRIPGYGGGDIVPALLEKGEYVLPKQLVAKIGPAAMEALRAGNIDTFVNMMGNVKRLQSGGATGSLERRTAQLDDRPFSIEIESLGDLEELGSEQVELLKELADIQSGDGAPLIPQLEADIGDLEDRLQRAVTLTVESPIDKRIEEFEKIASDFSKKLTTRLRATLQEFTFSNMGSVFSNALGVVGGFFDQLLGQWDDLFARIQEGNDDLNDNLNDQIAEQVRQLQKQLERNEVTYFDYLNQLEDIGGEGGQQQGQDDNLAEDFAAQILSGLGQVFGSEGDFTKELLEALEGQVDDTIKQALGSRGLTGKGLGQRRREFVSQQEQEVATIYGAILQKTEQLNNLKLEREMEASRQVATGLSQHAEVIGQATAEVARATGVEMSDESESRGLSLEDESESTFASASGAVGRASDNISGALRGMKSGIDDVIDALGAFEEALLGAQDREERERTPESELAIGRVESTGGGGSFRSSATMPRASSSPARGFSLMSEEVKTGLREMERQVEASSDSLREFQRSVKPLDSGDAEPLAETERANVLPRAPSEEASAAAEDVRGGRAGSDSPGGKALNVLGGIGKAIGDVLLKAVQGIFKLITRDFSDIADKFIGIIEELPTIIPQMVDSIVEAIPRIVDALITGVPVIIEKFLEGLPVIIETIIEGLTQLVPMIVAQIPRIIAGLADAITALARTLPALIQSLITSIVQNLPQIIGSLIQNLIPALIELVMELVIGVVNLIPQLLATLLDPRFIFDLVWNILKGIVKAFATLVKKVGELILNLLTFGIFGKLKNKGGNNKNKEKDFSEFHTGGIVKKRRNVYDEGLKLANDEVRSVLQVGEGVLTQKGIENLGGESVLHSLNAGTPMSKILRSERFLKDSTSKPLLTGDGPTSRETGPLRTTIDSKVDNRSSFEYNSSPQIVVQGNADEEVVRRALSDHEEAVKREVGRMMDSKRLRNDRKVNRTFDK